jgi:hypothetical protein
MQLLMLTLECPLTLLMIRDNYTIRDLYISMFLGI